MIPAVSSENLYRCATGRQEIAYWNLDNMLISEVEHVEIPAPLSPTRWNQGQYLQRWHLIKVIREFLSQIYPPSTIDP